MPWNGIMDFLWAQVPGCGEDAQKGLETGECEAFCGGHSTQGGRLGHRRS